MSKLDYQKTLLFETTEGIKVIDYSCYSYVVKTSREWYSIASNQEIIKNKLKNGKYAKGFKFDGESFSGWKFDKKSNSEDEMKQTLCKCT